MTSADRVGGHPDATGGVRRRSLNRPALFAIVAFVLVLNGYAGKIAKSAHGDSLLIAILDLGGVSAIVWFAAFSFFTIASEDEASEGLRRLDRGILAAALLLALLPLNFAGAIGLLATGGYLCGSSASGTPARRLAIVMVALTGPLIWGRVLLALIGPKLLSVDAHVAGFLADVPVSGNIVPFHDGTGSLYVALSCSSVHNMSLAVLLFVTLTQLQRLKMNTALIAAGGAAMLAMAAINMLRLATMARYPEHFAFVHTGWGGTLFGVASFVTAAVIIGAGTVAARPR
jgi:exosortase/archaeosortase family protein